MDGGGKDLQKFCKSAGHAQHPPKVFDTEKNNNKQEGYTAVTANTVSRLRLAHHHQPLVKPSPFLLQTAI